MADTPKDDPPKTTQSGGNDPKIVQQQQVSNDPKQSVRLRPEQKNYGGGKGK